MFGGYCILSLTDKFRKVNRINKTFFGKSTEYIIFASAIYCNMQNLCKRSCSSTDRIEVS
ncbi:hypothetical protein DW940_02015 [Bacteroides uniformis]|uniref:Uncharacterized protein n=1 Tax=Bacteroides uniformis TaxID=820 RepID=A0A414IIZ0_BACUN|nr:hypothetical protein GAO04_12930 [Bacteroides uniformis]RGI97744.1 hypothetical protein DXD78_18610 [Bacteroides sp. D20]RGJ32735.1 hypothetical protein DXD65_12820 [Bacteroides sp. 4_1_36]RJU40013.1 hypothetical protein DW896_18890 [Bacteroides sp. AM41-16]RJV14624.1 hypothetical protein DWY74_13430 [Bacteroides sp. AF27-10BH]RJV19289.1 hypothetical protein DWY62_10660 [Bacteroides sp. AF26-10BH]RJV42686.1 hypothetical protein DWX62_01790 [Bacteroides sp. AF20-13LB]RJV49132.1 hypothetica